MSDDGWIRVTTLDELPIEGATRVDLDGTPVLLVRATDRIYAIGNRCTHQGAPLDRGHLRLGGSEATVTCLAHGSTFRLADGAVLRPPATTPAATYDVRVDDGAVHLRPATG